MPQNYIKKKQQEEPSLTIETLLSTATDKGLCLCKLLKEGHGAYYGEYYLAGKSQVNTMLWLSETKSLKIFL